MTKKLFLLFTLGLIFVFTTSGLCYGKSIETRILLKDIKRFQKFKDKQYDLLMQFFDSLTPEDVEVLNSGKYEIEIDNQKAASIWKKVKKFDSYSKPIKVKHPDMIAHNFFVSWSRNVCPYGEILVDYGLIKNYVSGGFKIKYLVPKEECEQALNALAEYSIHQLNQLQELRGKIEDLGLKITDFPRTINNINLSTGSWPVLLKFSSIKKDNYYATLRIIRWQWQEDLKSYPGLYYSNKNVLTVGKLWLDFMLDNDLSGDASDEEKAMRELDKIEKRLAKMSETPKKQQEPAKDSIDKSEPVQKTSPPDKPKFKLDLPK